MFFRVLAFDCLMLFGGCGLIHLRFYFLVPFDCLIEWFGVLELA